MEVVRLLLDLGADPDDNSTSPALLAGALERGQMDRRHLGSTGRRYRIVDMLVSMEASQVTIITRP